MDWTHPCADCGTDTDPLSPDSAEYYMIHDKLWRKAGMGKLGYLCIGCLEARLGRRLRPKDFTSAPVNSPDWPRHSERLRSRLRP